MYAITRRSTSTCDSPPEVETEPLKSPGERYNARSHTISMWLLTCDGDLFGHKPIWLRPGSGHLLGRTSGRAEGGEVVRYINHKSVSRKHATIHVGQIKSGDSSRLHTRSEIKITDGSKIGTFINGDKICQTSRVLDRTEYTIKLGNYEHTFHLKWQPVVLTFTSLSKAAKASSDPLEAYRKKLEQAEVKLITEYVSSQTTHVIGKKRNTPPGLQALLQGRWLLAYSFVDALARATTKPDRDADGNSRPCPIEEDFKTNWPEEEDHILPAALEPNPKPNEYLKPNPQRAELFSNFMFIFLSQAQYDLLMPVVTSGSGKALLWDVEVGKSKAEDLIGYVREVAGGKKGGDVRLSQHTGKGGVVLVRLDNKEKEWTTSFLASVETALEQRSMEQNQFLNAILSVDASELRRPLARESQSQSQIAPSFNSRSDQPSSRVRNRDRQPTPPVEAQAPEPTTEQDQPQRQPSEQPETMEPTGRKKFRRTVTQSRFKGFGEVDPSQFTRPESDSPEPSQVVPDEQSMQVDEPSYREPSQQNSRKRPAPTEDAYGAEAEKAMMDNMLPGAAAMKKRRLQANQNGKDGSSGNATPEPEVAAAAAKKVIAKKAKDVQIDVGAKLKKHKEDEDEARRRDEESLREALQDTDIADVRAKVESFVLEAREPPPRRAQIEPPGPSDRWDPAWNGRKNFKRFKRKGQDNDGPRLPRVIVSLEEVPRKGHGIGDEYWLNPPSKSSGKSKSQSQPQNHTQGTTQPHTQTPTSHQNGDDDPTRFRRRLQNSRREDEEASEMREVFPDEVAGQSRSSYASTPFTSTASQTLQTSQKRSTGKRPPAAAALQDEPAAKRAKQSRPATRREPVVIDDDDDDDEIKFRRKRR